MKIILIVAVVQSLNLLIFTWFNRTAWIGFLKNQAQVLWSCDFFVQPSIGFRVLCEFVIMELSSRKVIHLNATDHPTLEWTKQQIRNACFEEQPKFLLHDNDGKYGQFGRPLQVEKQGKKTSCRSAYDEWLWDEIGIRGIPIPYGAPNAAAIIEKGIMRNNEKDDIS